MHRRLLGTVAAFVVVAALAGCDDDVDRATGTARGDGAPPEPVVVEVCRAAQSAGAGDTAAAAAGFADVHASLHELADRLGADGAARRADASRLLEAKQRVEAGLEAGEGRAQLAGDLRTLAGVVGEVTGELVPAGCR